MAKVANTISYINGGKVISANVLKQPPDLLSSNSMLQAMQIILQINRVEPQPPCYIQIMQGETELKTVQYEPP